jgi:hypothetical protein
MVVNRIENNSSRHETKTPKMLLKLTINTSEDGSHLLTTMYKRCTEAFSLLLIVTHLSDEKQYPNSQYTLPESTSLCLVSVYVTLGSLSFAFPGTANGRFELSWQNFR